MKASVNEYNLPERVLRWSGPFIIAVVAVLGLIWSWGTWPDVLVDFGRELYVPWRLTEGQVLYRDIASFNGPFSPYVLALWFYCFSVSLQSLFIFNAFIIAGVLCLLYRIFFQIAGRISATLSCLTFLVGFAFSEFSDTGSYSWMCPYSHEMTHGVALSLLSIYLLFHYASSCKLIWIGVSGLVLGLVFLTKAEIFLAVFVGNIAGIFAMLWLKRYGWKFTLLTVTVWLGSTMLPIVISYILLSIAMSPSDALYATMGSWPHVFNSDIKKLLFYKLVMGTLNPIESIIIILKWVGWYILIFAPAVGLSFICRHVKIAPLKISIITFLLVSSVFLLLLYKEMIAWYDIPRPWQVFVILLGLILFWPIVRRRYESKEHPAVILRFAITLFSFVLLARMFLSVHIVHYGFALALPATLMLVVALWDWIPEILRKLGGQTIVFRGAVFAVLLVTATVHIIISDKSLNNKNYVVGSEADAFMSDKRGIHVEKAIQILRKKMKDGETLAVLPEGIMLNYQLRVQNPTPYVVYLPLEIIINGEDEMIKSFQRHPPNYVVLIHRDTSEYGFRFFGKDYGKSLWNWITENYVFTNHIGAMPFNSNDFGIMIGEKKD